MYDPRQFHLFSSALICAHLCSSGSSVVHFIAFFTTTLMPLSVNGGDFSHVFFVFISSSLALISSFIVRFNKTMPWAGGPFWCRVA